MKQHHLKKFDSNLLILPKESYHLSFKAKGMSVLMTDINKNMFQELDPLYIIYDNTYYQFFPQEEYKYAQEKGLELFSNTLDFKKYEASLKRVQRELEAIFLKIKKGNLTKDLLEQFMHRCAEFCIHYGKMNSEEKSDQSY